MMDDVATAPTRAWSRVKWTRAAQVAPMLDDASPLEAVGAMRPMDAFAVLRDSDPAAAAHLVAHCLSRVDAIRWLAACLAYADANPPPARAVAAKAVRRWLAAPGDEARRLAHEAGEIAGLDTPEGLACLAIFMSGGSIAPAAQQIPVNPPPGVFGKVVAGAALAVAHAKGGPAFAARMEALLARADAIAAGERPA